MILVELLIILKLFSFCVSQDIVFRDTNIYLGDPCIIESDKSLGICQLLTDCLSILKTRPKPTCGFSDRIPIVCCPNALTPRINLKRISSIKCDTYKNLLNQQLLLEVFSLIEGTITQSAEFPHLAIVGWRKANDQIVYECGGSLISEKFILTAAHCISDRGIPPSIVRLGEHDLTSASSSVFEQYGIHRIVIHPSYKISSTYNDIALIELDATVVLKKNIRPACLWQNYEPDNKTAIATGWRKSKYGDESSHILQKIELKLFSNDYCNKSFPQSTRISEGIISSQICYGDKSVVNETCQGDGGGSLQTRNNYSTEFMYDIIGVASFGTFCGAVLPSVYTRVFSYLDWIEEVVWERS